MLNLSCTSLRYASVKKLKQPQPTESRSVFYIQAFHELSDKRLPTGESSQHLSELQGLLEAIANIRSRRNNFAHEYASLEAMTNAAQREKKSDDYAGADKAFKDNQHTGSFLVELSDAHKVLGRAGNVVLCLEEDVTENCGQE